MMYVKNCSTQVSSKNFIVSGLTTSSLSSHLLIDIQVVSMSWLPSIFFCVIFQFHVDSLA